MKILPKEGYFEYEEKRSKFLACCTPVKTEEEAKAIINKIRKAHPKANHNVFAYELRTGGITRMSDDGEPTGTAALPILHLFQKTGVVDYVCVVTRYFGGTMLGSGGLVRAYGKAAKGAMEAAAPEEEILFKIYRLTCHYNQFDKLKYNFDKWEIEIQNVEYTDHCLITAKVTEHQESVFQSGDFYRIL